MVQRRKRLLDVDTILEAALMVIDGHGRLRMSDLAAQLGTSASSVYHHISGREAIIELLRERVVGAAIDSPPLDETDWVEQLASWMRSYRTALAKHPSLIPLLNEYTITATPVLSDYDRVAALLGRAGVPDRDVMLWITVFDCYTVGAALDLTTPDDVWRSGDGDLPVLDAALRAGPRGRRRADEAFEIGLEALLSGLRHRLTAED